MGKSWFKMMFTSKLGCTLSFQIWGPGLHNSNTYLNSAETNIKRKVLPSSLTICRLPCVISSLMNLEPHLILYKRNLVPKLSPDISLFSETNRNNEIRHGINPWLIIPLFWVALNSLNWTRWAGYGNIHHKSRTAQTSDFWCTAMGLIQTWSLNGQAEETTSRLSARKGLDSIDMRTESPDEERRVWGLAEARNCTEIKPETLNAHI